MQNNSYIQSFIEDIKDFLSSKTTKDEFINAVEKGAGTYDEVGSYGMDMKDAYNMEEFQDDLYKLTQKTSSSQQLKLYDALDSIIYTTDNKFNLDGLKESFFRGEKFQAKGTKASLLAASAMYALANSQNHGNTFSIFYKDKELQDSVVSAFKYVYEGKECGLIKERCMYACYEYMENKEKQATEHYHPAKEIVR